MPDTPTPKLGLLRPPLGKKPWKEDWDFNFLKLDNIVGGLVDGTVQAGDTILIGGKTPAQLVQTVSGTLAGIDVLDNTVRQVEIDHSTDVVFDSPSAPRLVVPSGVRSVVVGDSESLSSTAYGGTFRISIENSSGATVSGVNITWRRSGYKG